MNKLALILITLLLGCSQKISECFEHNRYIRNYNIHIVNDSLQLYFKSPADITYVTDKSELKKIISKTKYKLDGKVLAYGKTYEPPYEYFVTIAKKHRPEYPDNIVGFDTLINNIRIQFIGNSIGGGSNATLKIDLRNIFESLEVGPSYRKEISTVMDIVKKYQTSTKYFAALNEIVEFPTYDKQEEWAKLQMALTYSSFLGKNKFYDSYLNKLESGFVRNDTISKIIAENSETDEKAIDLIVREARNHKIVMVNENHFFPNHRLLISDLLEELQKIGYRYLALEALDIKQDSLLNLENSYPTLQTGFYTSEQNYANLIRKAKKFGYQFVAYENSDSTKNRELGQAENLYNKTFKRDSTSRVLVLAGIDHILENQTDSRKEWMATLFKEKYNIDPLTISQTHLNAYRKQIKANYSIIGSEFFKSDGLKAIDYLMLNNNDVNRAGNTSTFTYQNKANRDVQISLFYGKEMSNEYDYFEKLPYFSAILKSGGKYELPVNPQEETYLYTFDENGRKIDSQKIPPRTDR